MPGGGGGGGAAAALGGWRHRAAQFYFLLIFFSFPLFSIPCQKGSCSSPVEVVAANLFSNGVDEAIVKALLYPGLVFSKIEAIVADNEPFAFPDWNHLLRDMNMTIMVHNKGETYLPSFGLLIGCYLCIVGAFLSAFGTTLIGTCGMLTLLWYIYKDGGTRSDVFALPMFGVAMFCSIGGLLKLEGNFRKEPEAAELSSSPSVREEKKQH